MAWITTKATLAKDPNPIQTRTGSPMAGGFCFARLGGEGPDLPLSMVAFGSVAEALLQYGRGQTVHISGDLKVHQYTNRQQEQVEQTQVILDTITGAKEARPIRKGESKRQSQPAPQAQPQTQHQAQQGQWSQRPAPNPAAVDHQNAMAFQQPVAGNDFQDDDINF